MLEVVSSGGEHPCRGNMPGRYQCLAMFRVFHPLYISPTEKGTLTHHHRDIEDFKNYRCPSMQPLWSTRHDSALYDAEARELLRRGARQSLLSASLEHRLFAHHKKTEWMLFVTTALQTRSVRHGSVHSLCIRPSTPFRSHELREHVCLRVVLLTSLLYPIAKLAPGTRNLVASAVSSTSSSGGGYFSTPHGIRGVPWQLMEHYSSAQYSRSKPCHARKTMGHSFVRKCDAGQCPLLRFCG